MDLKKRGFSKNFSLLCLSLFSLVALLSFVSAAPNAPTGLTFHGNTTAYYDEGNFSVNWTSGGGNPAASYNVYIYAGGTLFKKASNNSVTGYSFSNSTEGNYTFKIGAVNATSTEVNSTTNVSMYVDRTSPIIALIGYTNATLETNTSDFTLNISVTDVSSGTTGSVCLVDVNGTNQTISSSNGWCNSTTISLSGASDGNNTIKVYVNDTVGNFGLNDSYVAQLDSTGPTVTASCSPSTVQARDPFPCTCSSNDSVSGINTSSSSSTSNSVTSTDDAGSFVFTCTVTDFAGNTASASTDYVVTPTYSSRGNSGSVTNTQSSNSQTFTKITPGVVTIMKNFDSSIDLKQIQISVQNLAQNVKITVTKYSSKPTAVSVEKSGNVIQYLHIDTENLLNNLKNVTVEFKVNKTQAKNKEDIVISRFNETSKTWDDLETKLSGEDGNYYYYTVELKSLSYFAISENTALVADNSQNTNETSQEQSNHSIALAISVILVVAIPLWLIVKNKRR